MKSEEMEASIKLRRYSIIFLGGCIEQELSFRVKVINVVECPGSHSWPKGRIFLLGCSLVSLV